MSLVDVLPIVAAVMFIMAGIIVIRGGGHGNMRGKGLWMVPTLFSVFLLMWSLAAGIKEGSIGFWTEHVRNMWGNQIWFDLLIAGAMAWFLMVPKAKSLGMRLPLWLLFIGCTGSVGGAAMLSRILYLEEKQAD